MNKKVVLRFNYSIIIFLSIGIYFTSIESLIGQTESLEPIISSFSKYSNPYRELAYCQLNKSTYLKGEMLGFSAYVLDKDLKVPSKNSKNLYCVVTDSNNKIVKSKLVRLTDGFANNVFSIDSSFTSGNYTFKAYTNWMRNFDEPNAFIELFHVIEPESENVVKKPVIEESLDAQFLPEGGYLITSVQTVVGVIIKNAQGLGVSNIEGKVYNTNNELKATFRTNEMGISRFLLIPDINERYIVKINHLNRISKYQLDDVKLKGISINVNNTRNSLAIVFRTNEGTLNDIKGKLFKMTIHNGKGVNGFTFRFDRKEIVRILDYKLLFPGTNIITLFDEQNRPILERLFFNYNGVNLLTTDNLIYDVRRDSTHIKIPLKNFGNESNIYSNISISVLPEKTKAHQRHHNIISHTYLQPYLKGYIENAQYYFTNVDFKIKYDLDILLITQGWSSYKWDNIFEYNITDDYAYEDGIVLRAHQQDSRQKDFVIYPLKYSNVVVLNLTDDQNRFVVSNLYPTGDERLSIGTLNKSGKTKDSPKLYLQFFPSNISNYNFNNYILQPRTSNLTQNLSDSMFTQVDLNLTQVLEEVVVEGKSRITKIKDLENSFSRVDIFDDKKRAMNLTLASYINYYVPGFVAFEGGGTLSINKRVTTTLIGANQSPLIYLDDLLISGLDYFYAFDMSNVDYVTVNENGNGEGFLGANGVIKIYTSFDYRKKRDDNSFRQFDFPLTFSEDKKFYAPKYKVYNDSFFNEYGVIDWFPRCSLDENGILNFTVYNPAKNDMKLFVEGVTGEGNFVSETIVLKLNDDN
ncbi:hypothetical protein V8G61_08420 [Gaetbulibacter sp. M240]|uniref:hypothetical protein n=1 Tax=Gaetbulibacter sp. M240 TaxID=3126511 RepID=UPI00374EA3A2